MAWRLLPVFCNSGRSFRIVTLTRLAAVFLALTVLASGASAIQAAPCDGPEYRAFDFWIGEWDVHRPDGSLAGRNRIEKVYGGCALQETYAATSAGAAATSYRGESLNAYDAGRKVWHQTWVDNSGLLLLLDGGLEDGKMVLQGTTLAPDGTATRHRITWTPNPDGTVRQLWESAEGAEGGTWTTAFDGLYRRGE